MAAIYLAPYAGILALLYVGLSYYVTGFRRRLRLPYGHSDDDAMQRAIRAQGNFAEYAPFGLLLLYLLAGVGTHPYVVSGLATALVLGRIAHAYSMLVVEPKYGKYTLRVAAMMLTFFSMAIVGILLLVAWFGFSFGAN
jgi:hypothetical protein